MRSNYFFLSYAYLFIYFHRIVVAVGDDNDHDDELQKLLE